MNILDDVWKCLNNKPLRPFKELNTDSARKSIDDAFSEILNIPSVNSLHELLSAEPIFGSDRN
jgi:hypothetical protein